MLALMLFAPALVAVAVGVSLLVFSNGMYYGRTLDKRYGRRFWLSKELLTHQEWVLNRVGFWLSVGACAYLAACAVVLKSFR